MALKTVVGQLAEVIRGMIFYSYAGADRSKYADSLYEKKAQGFISLFRAHLSPSCAPADQFTFSSVMLACVVD